jgi:hypothetical protein
MLGCSPIVKPQQPLLGVTGNDFIGAITFPQRLSGVGLYEPERGGDKLMEQQLSISRNPVHISIVDVTSSARIPAPKSVEITRRC